ncbi:MAG: chemotaxis protein CheW [Candidatus Latescibacteria bacterium]|nr:chemotaxis protein CheW [Candidatus Latescibacterota bacterium]
MSVNLQMKILVVEDSGITRKMEVKALRELGFTHIMEADDGETAIPLLMKENDIDLIISDWNMPQKSGYDLLVWVRVNEKCKAIPFIMATARGEKKQTQMAVDAGVSNFITKPFGPAELKSVIDDTFEEKKEGYIEPEKPRHPRKTSSGKVILNVAHIQITDHLALGVLKHLIESEKLQPKHFELETQCMPGWNPVQQSLEKGDIDAAFILAPIAMDMFSADIPIKLVLFAHKNGSICVRNNNNDKQKSLKDFFKGKTFYIPHILSIHHMLTNMFLHEIGLKPGLAGNEGVDVNFEVVPPIKMPEFLAKNPDTGGFTVAEPLGTKAIAGGNANLMFLSGELWEYHPCCVVTARDEFINEYPEAIQEFVDMLVVSGQYIAHNHEKAAEIAVNFLDPGKKLGLNVAVLKNVLNEPQGIKTDDLFPAIEDLDRIQRYMSQEMGIGTMINLEKFVDTSFAQKACDKASTSRHHSVLHPMSRVVSDIQTRQASEPKNKTMLDKEGKYLFFSLEKQEYGIEIHSIKEIISLMPVRTIPQTPPFVKGVINLRKSVIPVIDLRAMLGLHEAEYTEHTCIIILELWIEGGFVKIGIIVDSVSEVFNIKATDIEETPTLGVGIDTEYILAMAKIGKGVKTLFNANRLFSSQETVMLSSLV